MLRATKKVKRGLGTIRQDLNVSIKGGGLVEIKGVQDLALVPKVVENEANRQFSLLRIRDVLREKGVKEGDFKRDFIDITQIFIETKCKLIKKAISNGYKVYAVTLPKFRGLMKIELEPGVRFATELADYAKFWGRVGGIFHTDELPGYGISEDEVSSLINTLNSKEDDIVVFTAGSEENLKDALTAVIERAQKSLIEVPSETRGANMDGSTHYSRPRPGSARMYPETDVPPVPISKEHVRQLKSNMPPLPDVVIKHLMDEYDLNKKLAAQIQASDYLDVFEKVASGTSVTPSFVAATLTETLVNLKREDIKIENLADDYIVAVFKFVDENKIVKEAVSDIFSWLSEHENSEVQEAINSLGLESLSEEQIETLVAEMLEEKKELVQKRGVKSLKPLLALFMSRWRGKADAKKVHYTLLNRLKGVVSKD
jgi:glutamyl-tRNA(Gln) amidotransferase subunit E